MEYFQTTKRHYLGLLCISVAGILTCMAVLEGARINGAMAAESIVVLLWLFSGLFILVFYNYLFGFLEIYEKVQTNPEIDPTQIVDFFIERKMLHGLEVVIKYKNGELVTIYLDFNGYKNLLKMVYPELQFFQEGTNPPSSIRIILYGLIVNLVGVGAFFYFRGNHFNIPDPYSYFNFVFFSSLSASLLFSFIDLFLGHVLRNNAGIFGQGFVTVALLVAFNFWFFTSQQDTILMAKDYRGDNYIYDFRDNDRAKLNEGDLILVKHNDRITAEKYMKGRSIASEQKIWGKIRPIKE